MTACRPREHWKTYGFVYVATVPLYVFSQIVFRETVPTFSPFRTVPIAEFIAAFYPLGLSLFMFAPLVFRPGGYESPEAGVAFSKGMRIAVYVLFAVSFPVGLITAVLSYTESLVGFSLVLVAGGSMMFPELSLASTCVYLFVSDQARLEAFLARARGHGFSAEARVLSWIALFFGRWELARRFSGTLQLAETFGGLYLLGWIFLSLAGGFPATLFGIILGILIPVSSTIAVRKGISREERQRLIDLLSKGTEN